MSHVYEVCSLLPLLSLLPFLTNQLDVIDIMVRGDVLQYIQVVQISLEYVMQKDKGLTYCWEKL